jgi:predicted Fe-Mo cluster-binding NifX family protein
MRIAIPVSQGKLDPHFGHCRSFALIDVDLGVKKITASATVDAPPHEPGLLPAWLSEKGTELVLAGGMGQKAVQLFAGHGVAVIVGVPTLDPVTLALGYLAGEIGAGANACNH